MNKFTEMLIKDQKYVVTGQFLKAVQNLNVSLNEMYILIYFENDKDKIFNPALMSECLSMDESDILESFNSLLSKNIISLESREDDAGRIVEKVILSGLYQEIENTLIISRNDIIRGNIYETFESEFGRTISPMEYEIINAWLQNDTSEELILGALKEAVYNGVKSFRYIDKILYTWNSKGFKTMPDVKNHLVTKDDKETKELFDYNWLEDDEN